MNKVFVTESSAIPGKEWFLNRDYPLTPDIVYADLIAMQRLVEQTIARVTKSEQTDDTPLRDEITQRWITKVVQTTDKV